MHNNEKRIEREVKRGEKKKEEDRVGSILH